MGTCGYLFHLVRDIEAETGATELVAANASQVNAVHLILGFAKSLNSSSKRTSIVGDPSFASLVSARITELRREIKRSVSSSNLALLNTSLFRLTGGVSLIHIGSTSPEALD